MTGSRERRSLHFQEKSNGGDGISGSAIQGDLARDPDGQHTPEEMRQLWNWQF
jgi:hypothetical protein